MSTPAGWYDDGSGRQRWWDGAQWTANYAPFAAAVDLQAPAPGTTGVPAPAPGSLPAPAGTPTPAGAKSSSTWGFVALGLAVLGAILGCIPVVPVIVAGMVALFAALIVGIVALFGKGTAKWPAIVGIVLSAFGGIVAGFVLVATLVVSFAGGQNDGLPAPPPATTSSALPSDAPGVTGRPSAQQLTDAFLMVAHRDNITKYDDPDVAACIGQALYDSDLSDETLQIVVTGEDPPGDEYYKASDVGREAMIACEKP